MVDAVAWFVSLDSRMMCNIWGDGVSYAVSGSLRKGLVANATGSREKKASEERIVVFAV